MIENPFSPEILNQLRILYAILGSEHEYQSGYQARQYLATTFQITVSIINQGNFFLIKGRIHIYFD